MVLGEDFSVPDELRPNPGLLALARDLGSHVDFLIIASNTPHFFMGDIEKASGLKVLSMVDVVLDEVQRRACSKVGVLAIG
jgi:aspartate/glutamate racemase